jgi:superfamily II DNA or RNA helicase
MTTDSILRSVLTEANLEPRPYQSRIVQKATDMFRGEYSDGARRTEPPARSVLIESPTGSGKSVMGLLVAKTLQTLTGARVGWVAMRRNLLEQVEQENRRRGINVDLRTISMFEKGPPTDIDLLVIDEAQHDASNSCSHLHNLIKPKWILGLTATPFRTDRVKLCFDKVVKDAGIHQLIQSGYLSQYDHYTVPRWDAETLADLYCADRERWGKSIFFFHTVEECYAFHRLLLAKGVASDVVTGTSDRELQLEAFRRGHTRVLVNCMVLTEGFDDPTLQTAWVRPSAKGPTMQMAGRALRKCEGVAVKNIVQCSQTSHPFVKTATPRQQFLWHAEGWRSLKVNPQMKVCSQNTCRVIAQTLVELPQFLLQKQQNRRRSRRVRV